MTTFPSSDITLPYWADGGSLSPGRDALGIQNSSVAVYRMLVPGITNVTERLRFYGWYCWLIDLYHRQDQFKDSAQSQYNFIRRAELVLAFYMQVYEPGFSAVPGSNFTFHFLPQLQEDGVLDLAAAADYQKKIKDTEGKNWSYWKYYAGALGQYYGGVLMDLGLLKTRQGYYLLDSRGEAFSEILQRTFEERAEKTLLSFIHSGQIHYDQLAQLQYFNLAEIKSGSEEWQHYIHLLFGVDRPETEANFQRCQTLTAFLQVSQELEFHQHLLGKFFFENPEEVVVAPDSASLGWQLYYAQELIHEAMEAIFSTMLQQIGERRWYPYAEFIADQVKMMKKTLAAHQVDDAQELGTWLTTCSGDLVDDSYGLLWEAYERKEAGPVYWHALQLIAATYQKVVPLMPDFQAYLEANQVGNRPGGILGVDGMFQNAVSFSWLTFFEHFIRRMLSTHQQVAYQKMGNGQKQVHRFLLENNHLVYINDITPRMTTPRLRAVKMMLEDLSLIDRESGQLTEEGEHVLKEYQDQQ